MFQSNSILMHKENVKLTEDELFLFLFNCFVPFFDNFQKINVYPRYECKKSKNNEIFDWQNENFARYVMNHRLKVEKETVGYSLAFFSDLIEDKSCGIRINISCDNLSPSVLEVQLSYEMCNQIYTNKEYCAEIKKLFINLVNAFDPFYACVINDKNITGFLYDAISFCPSQLHWINYFSNRIYKSFNNNDALNISELKLNKGCLICFGEEPIDIENRDIILKQKRAYGILVEKMFNENT